MEKQFTEQFKLLNEHFSAHVYAALRRRQRRCCKLQDEKDVLGCGIDIVAQPPGKKLQLLSLLSGGERALTAIAILFAMLDIQSHAVLHTGRDRGGAGRGERRQLRGLSETIFCTNTQFIVVTHRKGTMERCDALYGVAMEEKGVSRMVVCTAFRAAKATGGRKQ